jgi:hypothetical protein
MDKDNYRQQETTPATYNFKDNFNNQFANRYTNTNSDAGQFLPGQKSSSSGFTQY